MNQANQKDKKLGLGTTSAFVIANMIGAGVFTSLGFQLLGIHNVIAILLLWIIGGIIALCGSLVYSELGAAMPRSGGEYHYLTQIYHPIVGFLSGWISITVGFAAPVAAACMALGKYSSMTLHCSPQIIAITVLIIITAIHSYSISMGGGFQNIFTAFKVLLIIVFVVCGFLLIPHFQDLSGDFKTFSWKDLLSPGFVVSLFYVSYAFSGWNASAYIASEIKNPQKIIPKSLFFSTLLVTALYFLLNLTFLLTAPVSELKGTLDVGNVSAVHIFGVTGGNIMAMLISILLVSSISSMVFVGPRVSQVMGQDMKVLKFLSGKSKKGTPYVAVIFQSLISLIFILTSSFESTVLYIGFTLNLFTFLAVFGIFVHRAKFKNIERPYLTWGYPVVPIIFLLASTWSLAYLIISKPFESSMGFLTVMAGSIIYFINLYLEKLNILKTKNAL